MKKMIALILAAMMLISLSSFSFAEAEKTYKIGICNFVDDASLNQIIANIRARLTEIEQERNVKFDIMEDNCNLDGSVLEQIIANFMASDVQLMVGVATPVAMAMQGKTEDSGMPIVFAAVSDPVGAGLVETLDAPGGNLTGTSDYLDTNSVFNLIFALKPDAKKIALLYNPSEDASTAPIEAAKAILDEKGVSYKEYSGANVSEVMLAADAIVADEMDAVFTPTDNTIMASELSIYETLAQAGIPHFTGADSFALNGAFLGYGVDYANLGRETGDMVAEILLDGAAPASTPVKTFDNGTATVNTETCEMLGLKYEDVEGLFAPYCTKVQSIVTGESFDDVK
ncbi:MAG: ABC transporter substrate-binding protein [Clostridia bacterium]|nr:ABC transporter substrate-binding protein [Clostridia bacterium]